MKFFIFTLLLWPVILLAAAFAPLVVAFNQKAFGPFDVLACAFTGGVGTVSAWAWQNRSKLWAKAIIKITDIIDAPGHCEQAWLRENPKKGLA